LSLKSLPANYGYDALLFIDGSVDPRTQMGVAGYRLLYADNMTDFASEICIKYFKNTSSTHLEIRAALWALAKITHFNGSLAVVSDCQTLCQLPTRRASLEAKQFCNKQGKQLNLSEAYQSVFEYCDLWYEKSGKSLDFIQVKGHQKASERSPIQSEFAKLDREVRRQLRQIK
jgi:ribonuclease HI